MSPQVLSVNEGESPASNGRTGQIMGMGAITMMLGIACTEKDDWRRI